MKIVVSFDSFKGGMSAQQACQTAEDVIRKRLPSARTARVPMADGGEGTAEAMIGTMSGEWVPVRTVGPLPDMQVDAGYAWFEHRRLAVVEMAAASGLPLLSMKQRNPLLTTTYGTGQLIKAALKHDADEIWLAVGGSATVDGGVGAAQALGWRIFDKDGNSVPFGGGNLERIHLIERPAGFLPPPAKVLCDVDNPLCGKRGAARIFAPQKGATPEMVEQLETGLAHLADVVKTQLGKEIAPLPGSGAAGGLAAGAVAFLDAGLVSGIDAVMKATQFKKTLEDADWVITGEGSFDSQSLGGKVIAGILRTAKETRTRVAVIAGTLKLSDDECHRSGIDFAWSMRPRGMSLGEAIQREPELLTARIGDFVDAINGTG